MATLQRAIELAVKAHAEQEDPPGEPYILHPMRVMLRFADADHTSRMVAILHDAVERGKCTFELLQQEGFAADVVRAVQLLTHDKKTSSYADYVVKLKPDPIARAVKIADLQDNADLRYVDMRAKKSKKDKRRVVRYALSYKFLTDQMSKRDYLALMKDAEN